MKEEYIKNISFFKLYTTEYGSEYISVMYRGISFKICCNTFKTVEFKTGRGINGVEIFAIEILGEFINNNLHKCLYKIFKESNISEGLEGKQIIKLMIKNKIDNF